MAEQVKGRHHRARTRARRAVAALGCAAALASSTVARVARAQNQTFYLDRLFMAGAPDDAIALWRPQMGAKTRFFGQLGLGFGYEPFRLENEISNSTYRDEVSQHFGAPVQYQLEAYADVGVEILDRFAIQVELPVVLAQGPTSTDASFSGYTATLPQNVAAPMDTRIDARVIVFRTDDRSFKLGAEGALWLPTGNKYSFSGDGAASGQLSLAAEYDIKKFFFVANTGFQFRPPNTVASVNTTNDPNDGFAVGTEWRYGVGAFAPLRDGYLRIGATLFGSLGVAGTGATGLAANAPLEWMGEARLYLDQKKKGWFSAGGGTRLSTGYAPDFRLVAVVGYSFGVADTDPPSPGKRFKAERFADHGADRDHDHIPDDVDLCPDEPEDGKPPNPDDGCPALPDRDGDGIPDNVDKCPDQPEDFDGIQDADGCPEDDADKDGIPDAQDACPKEPGEPDPDPKKNGCPKFIRRISGSTEIQILKVIEFATGKATILPKSFPILDEVVRLLKVNLDIKSLGIEGHTDNRGSIQLNEKLSDDRAHSVMKYLVEHGVDASRLTAEGFGPKRPIADNNTNEGRQRNRRVEFHIKDTSAPAKPPAP